MENPSPSPQDDQSRRDSRPRSFSLTPSVTKKDDVEANRVQAKSQIIVSRSSTYSLNQEEHRDSLTKVPIILSPTRRVTRTLSITAQTVPFTKWSRKKYGSQNAVIGNHLHSLTPSFIIHPYSGFRFVWDIISCIVIVVNVITIPIDVALVDQKDNLGHSLQKLFSDSWFLMDILLNFRTAILVNDRSVLIFDLDKIQRHYLRRWFLVDLLTSFPFDFLISLGVSLDESVQVVHLLKIGKILSLIRIARITRLVRSLHQWEEVFNLQYDVTVSVLRLFNIMMLLFFLCHFNACVLFFIPKLYNFPDDSWVVLRGLTLQNSTVKHTYIWSLFRSTSNMLSIGWSQIVPRNLPDMWATMWSQASGHYLFVFYIAHAIIFMQELDYTQNAYKLKLSQVTHFLSFHRIQPELKRRVIEYYNTYYISAQRYERGIMRDLNPVLRAEVTWCNTAVLVQSVKLFYETSNEFVLEIGKKLQFSIYMPEDMIAKIDRKADGMFFISRGLVEVTPAHDDMVCRFLSDGTYFGEFSLVEADSRRSVSVKAVSIVQVQFLLRRDFFRVLKRCPKDKERIKKNLPKHTPHKSNFDQLMQQQLHIVDSDDSLLDDEDDNYIYTQEKTNDNVSPASS